MLLIIIKYYKALQFEQYFDITNIATNFKHENEYIYLKKLLDILKNYYDRTVF